MRRIAIHSAPRSGSTWLGQLLNSSPEVVYKFQPLFSYAFKDRLDAHASRQQIESFFQDIADCQDDFLDQAEHVKNGTCPLFEKLVPKFCVYKEVRYHHILRNLLDKDSDVMVVGLIRNPLAVMASWRMAPREFKPEWDFEQEWRTAPSKNLGRVEEFYGFDKWKEVASLFIDLQAEFPDRFRIIKYSELLAQPVDVTRDLFEFLKIPWQEQSEKFLADSRSVNHQDAYSVFKKKLRDDQWQGKIPESICNSIVQELRGTELEAFLDSIQSDD